MTKGHSTTHARSRKPRKPAKPHKDFPLTPHPSGRWCKKVRGKLHYFGPWSDPDGALTRWLDKKDDLLAGRIPRSRRQAADGPALHELVNRFLTTKRTLMDAGELSPYTWKAYHDICEAIVAAFGRDRLLNDILPEDFEQLRAKWAKTWGPVRLAAEVNRARVVFNYAWKNGLIVAPIRFGEGFKRPSKKALRLNRAEQGLKMFETAELRKMIDSATQPIKAMLLLAINAGLGNTDISQMTLKAFDLDSAWLNYPRPKTGIARRAALWPETVSALREWLAERPTPKEGTEDDLVFLTFRGKSWTPNLKSRPITNETRKLLDRLGITGKRNFYSVRHTFETIGGESKDQVAVNAIMGHDDGTMGNAYRERIGDDRLRAVADHVRAWLFAEAHPKLKIAATA